MLPNPESNLSDQLIDVKSSKSSIKDLTSKFHLRFRTKLRREAVAALTAGSFGRERRFINRISGSQCLGHFRGYPASTHSTLGLTVSPDLSLYTGHSFHLRTDRLKG